jgi:two-component system, OmpR family, KDP operon response regulator KdpE
MSGPFGVQPLILVVEDDPQLARPIVSALATHGFRTLRAAPTTLVRSLGHDPDLVLVDAGSPSFDGVGLTAQLRDLSSTTPIIVLLAGESDDPRPILDAGASDYIVRPFALSDLLARVRVWLRQGARGPAQPVEAHRPHERLRIDRERRTVIVEGREIHLTPLEFKLLLVLAQNSGRSMTEDQILTALWGPKTSTRKQYLRAHVRQLRQKLEREPAHPRHLVADIAGNYRLKLS